MNEKTVFAGFGGQGIISLGQIWVYAGMKEGKNVSFFPFYGAEKRGGIARANCVISDVSIASPVISKADSAVVMNRDSLESSVKLLKEGGLLLVNSSLVPPAEIPASLTSGLRVIPVAATEIAEKLGNVRIANMVMLGALAKVTGAVVLDNIEAILANFFPGSKQKLIPVNVSAIMAGMESCS